MAVQLDKSTFFFSFFNSRVYGEVKSNIRYFRKYNFEALANSKVNNIILEIIDNNVITDVNESYIRTAFKTEGLLDNEINPIIDKIIDFKLGDSSADKVIDQVLNYVRQAVHKTVVDAITREYKNDPVRLVEEIQNFHYVGMAKDKVPFEKFSTMNIDEVSSEEFKLLFKTGLKCIDNSNALGGIISAKLYQIVGRPGGGKSMLMMYLAILACFAHRKTAYIAMGDLNKAAFITRMYAMAKDIPLMDAILDQKSAFEYVSSGDIDKYFNLCVVPAKEVSVYDIVEAVRDLDAEVVFIDYDSNLKTIAGSMYEEGDLTYAEATKLTIGDHRTVFIASQPKPCYWNNDYLDLLCANESSKKQMHVRIMITIGKHLNPDGTPCGYITLPKNDMGMETQSPYLRSSSGRFIEVDKVTYAAYADAHIGRTLDSEEILSEVEFNTRGDNPLGSQTTDQAEKKVKENENLNNFADSIPDAK